MMYGAGTKKFLYQMLDHGRPSYRSPVVVVADPRDDEAMNSKSVPDVFRSEAEDSEPPSPVPKKKVRISAPLNRVSPMPSYQNAALSASLIDPDLLREMMQFPLATSEVVFSTANIHEIIDTRRSSYLYARNQIKKRKYGRQRPTVREDDIYNGILADIYQFGYRYFTYDGWYIPTKICDPCDGPDAEICIDLHVKTSGDTLFAKTVEACLAQCALETDQIYEVNLHFTEDDPNFSVNEWAQVWRSARNTSLRSEMAFGVEFGVTVQSSATFLRFLKAVETKPDFIEYDPYDDEDDLAELKEYCTKNGISKAEIDDEDPFPTTHSRADIVGCIVKRNMEIMKETFLARYRVDKSHGRGYEAYVNGFRRETEEEIDEEEFVFPPLYDDEDEDVGARPRSAYF